MAARWTDPPLRVSKDELLARFMGVQASMERDGWGPARPWPPGWDPGIDATQTARVLRFLWWRDYGVPEWFEASSGETEPQAPADEDQP